MGFATALSGLKASATGLQVTGNNIANSQTAGFKQSRAEFADVYASSLGGVSKTQPGSGVKVTTVAQQFNQGNIESTQNSLDLAVSGNGFFVFADNVNLPDPNAPNDPVDPSVPSAYTRNGAFQLNSRGNVINQKGQYLLAFAPNGTTKEEGFSVGVFKPLTIDTAQGLPSATQNIEMKLNINAAANVPAVTPFDPEDPLSYNNTTSVTTYDSQGNSHIAAVYFVKKAPLDPADPDFDPNVKNQWEAYLFLDNFGITTGGPSAKPLPAPASTVVGGYDTTTTPPTVGTPYTVGAPMTLAFSDAGLLESIDGVLATSNIEFGDIDLAKIDPTLAVKPMAFDLSFFGTTHFATPYSVNGLNQDGLPAGNLTGIDVDPEGVVFARYSNGGSKALGQVALARFQANQSLSKLGDTTWATTSSSGAPIYGAAGDNNFGGIQSSALEGSNVDLSEQLVKLIVQQQAYQANSQTITTEKSLLETILRA